MKKIYSSMIITLILTYILVMPGTVSAAQTYTSTLNLPENSSMIGAYRWYDTGNFRIQVNIDGYNGCSAGSEKLMWITLHYSPTRQMGGQMIGTQLYTCANTTIGSFSNGRYAYTFSTQYSSGRVFCGVVSNYVKMYQ
jgi:hypothetical protein